VRAQSELDMASNGVAPLTILKEKNSRKHVVALRTRFRRLLIAHSIGRLLSLQFCARDQLLLLFRNGAQVTPRLCLTTTHLQCEKG
jgi:hypothetical protein